MKLTAIEYHFKAKEKLEAHIATRTRDVVGVPTQELTAYALSIAEAKGIVIGLEISKMILDQIRDEAKND